MKIIGKKYGGSKIAIKVYQNSDPREVIHGTVSQLCTWLREYGYEHTAHTIQNTVSPVNLESNLTIDEGVMALEDSYENERI